MFSGGFPALHVAWVSKALFGRMKMWMTHVSCGQGNQSRRMVLQVPQTQVEDVEVMQFPQLVAQSRAPQVLVEVTAQFPLLVRHSPSSVPEAQSPCARQSWQSSVARSSSAALRYIEPMGIAMCSLTWRWWTADFLLPRRRMVGMQPSKNRSWAMRCWPLCWTAKMSSVTDWPTWDKILVCERWSRAIVGSTEAWLWQSSWQRHVRHLRMLLCSTWKCIAGTATTQKHLAMSSQHPSTRWWFGLAPPAMCDFNHETVCWRVSRQEPVAQSLVCTGLQWLGPWCWSHRLWWG